MKKQKQIFIIATQKEVKDDSTSHFFKFKHFKHSVTHRVRSSYPEPLKVEAVSTFDPAHHI